MVPNSGKKVNIIMEIFNLKPFSYFCLRLLYPAKATTLTKTVAAIQEQH